MDRLIFEVKKINTDVMKELKKLESDGYIEPMKNQHLLQAIDELFNNASFRCFDCQSIAFTELKLYEKGKQEVKCSCGSLYDVTQYKNGKLNVRKKDEPKISEANEEKEISSHIK